MAKGLTLVVAAAAAQFVAMAIDVSVASAQVIGPLRWRMQPYCNVVTLTIEQKGATYLLTGTDDNCGLSAPSTSIGVATQGAGAAVVLGFSTFTPTGVASHATVTLDLGTLSGPWTDDNGNTGQFVFTPAGSSGAPRPSPRTVVGTAQIAVGAVTPDRLSPSVFAGSGVAPTASRSDHIHDDRYMTRAESQAAFVPRSVLGGLGYYGTARVSTGGTVDFQRSTNGQAITVSKNEPGVYFVYFPGAFAGSFQQNISITDATGLITTGWRHCSVNQPQATGTTFIVAISCVNSSFQRADAAFYITVTS